MSVPRDIYVKAPTYYVGAPYLLFRGSEIIMLGPDLSCGDPDLLRLGTEIIMWEPRLCRGRYLSRRDPEIIIWRTWIIMLGRDNHVWVPIYHVGAPTHYVGAPNIMSHNKYPLDFLNYIHIWQVSLQLSYDDTLQMWTYAIAEMCHDNAEKLGKYQNEGSWLDNPNAKFRSKGTYLSPMFVHRNQYWVYGYHNSCWDMKCAQHAAHNKKIETTGLLGYPCCWHFQRLKDPAAWLDVVNTLEVWDG